MSAKEIGRRSLFALIVLASFPALAAVGLESVIRDYARNHSFDGVVLVAEHGKPVFHGAFGIADRSFAVPFARNDVFRIASITKLFTSVLILQLYEQRRVDLNAPIQTYLPDYSGAGASRVTVRHLLTHTSGIQNSDQVSSYEEAARRGIEMYQLPHSTKELLRRYASGPLIHEPGQAFDYNNGDYFILGAIAERLTGRTYDELLTERILAPLHLTSSGVLYQSRIVRRLAPTYMTPASGSLINDMPVYFENWYAAGAMYSTAADLSQFASALFDGRLLKPETLRLMLTPGMDDYGYGLWIVNWKINGKSHRVALRPGRIMGANVALVRYLDDDVTVIILANTDQTDVAVFAHEVGKAIFN